MREEQPLRLFGAPPSTLSVLAASLHCPSVSTCWAKKGLLGEASGLLAGVPSGTTSMNDERPTMNVVSYCKLKTTN